MERLALVGILETESPGWLGRARVSEVMDLTRHLDVRLACLERLWLLSIDFIDNRAFNHIHKPRRAHRRTGDGAKGELTGSWHLLPGY
ncbi:MAG: hypothetical protein WAV78_35545 [Xanthobacteraceae bacterium]